MIQVVPLFQQNCATSGTSSFNTMDTTFSSWTCSAVKYFLLPSVWMKFPAQKTADSHNQELFRNLRTKFRRELWKRNRQNTCSHSSLAASTLVRVPVSTFFVRLDFCIQARPQYNENMALIHSFILEASTALINSKLYHSCTIKRKKDVSSKRTLNIWQFGCVLVDMQSQFYFTGECRIRHSPTSWPTQ